MGACLSDHPPAIEPQGFARFPHGEVTRVWIVLGGVIADEANAECVQQTRDQPQMIHDLPAGWWRRWREGRAGRWSPSLLSCREDELDPPKFLHDTCVVRNVGCINPDSSLTLAMLARMFRSTSTHCLIASARPSATTIEADLLMRDGGSFLRNGTISIPRPKPAAAKMITTGAHPNSTARSERYKTPMAPCT